MTVGLRKPPILILNGRLLRCQEWTLSTRLLNEEQQMWEWRSFGKLMSTPLLERTLSYVPRGRDPQHDRTLEVTQPQIEYRRSGRCVIKCTSAPSF